MFGALTQFGRLGAPSGNLYSAEATALFAAMSVQPNGALKSAYDRCMRSLKVAALWTKLDALYLMNVHDAQAARLNVRSPGTYNLSAVNSPTFAAKQGYTGNGSNSYLNTQFNPTTAPSPNYLRDSSTAFAWSFGATTAGSNDPIFGSVNGGNALILSRENDGLSYFSTNPTTGFMTIAGAASALLQVNRSSSTARQAYKNGGSQATNSIASVALTSGNLAFLRDATFFGDNGGVALGGFGSSFTSGEAATLNTILSTFKTAAEAS